MVFGCLKARSRSHEVLHYEIWPYRGIQSGPPCALTTLWQNTLDEASKREFLPPPSLRFTLIHYRSNGYPRIRAHMSTLNLVARDVRRGLADDTPRLWLERSLRVWFRSLLYLSTFIACSSVDVPSPLPCSLMNSPETGYEFTSGRIMSLFVPSFHSVICAFSALGRDGDVDEMGTQRPQRPIDGQGSGPSTGISVRYLHLAFPCAPTFLTDVVLFRASVLIRDASDSHAHQVQDDIRASLSPGQ